VQFADEIETAALRCGGEYAWRRADALRAAHALADKELAILGGELWLLHETEVFGVLPQHSGAPAVYHWRCERMPSESWSQFVTRACSESVSAIQDLPPEGEVETPAGAEIYYNLTWVSEHE
jgi:hypothetical protein